MNYHHYRLHKKTQLQPFLMHLILGEFLLNFTEKPLKFSVCCFQQNNYSLLEA